MRDLIHRLARFWSTDRSLTALLVLLVLTLFVLPPMGTPEKLDDIANRVLYTLLVISGVLAATRNRRATVIAALVVGTDVILKWVALAVPGQAILIASTASSLVTVVMLILVVVVQVFREGPITMHRVLGAVAVYLLLGLAWTLAYQLVSLSVPGAFTVSTESATRMNVFIYYSFVTLTTVGYGDITALHPVARSLSVTEALTGQLYPAILIARLVAMELFFRQARMEIHTRRRAAAEGALRGESAAKPPGHGLPTTD